ncbi:hypothetical protein [Sphingorhabdus sp.]|uniref:hypothetical protein n=1 Tax=Sphingorhabdus sp. TaxID=1902408 RepID=UPI003593EAF1
MSKAVSNSQIRAIMLAMAGAIIVSVTIMFLPVRLLEIATGSTGLSEMIPAARAPLGDTARALFAFGAGAFTLAVLVYALLHFGTASVKRIEVEEPIPDWANEPEDAKVASRLARLKMPSLSIPKMPWVHDDSDITELSDLPKLRNGDTHPDAPPRRPLFANQDLPVIDLAEIATEMTPDPQSEIVVDEAAAVSSDPVMVSPLSVKQDIEPTLAEMVAQLEAAVADRQKQLTELEIVATQLASRTVVQPVHDDIADIEEIAEVDVTFEPTRDGRPSLEIVPDFVVKDDDMDSALAAALATLNRMNGTAR